MTLDDRMREMYLDKVRRGLLPPTKGMIIAGLIGSLIRLVVKTTIIALVVWGVWRLVS